MSDDLVRELANQQIDYARRQVAKFLATQDKGLLDQAVSATEAAIELVERTQPPELIGYFRLAEQLRISRWLVARDDADLEVIISRCSQIDAVPSANSSENAVHHGAVAQAYEVRFDENGNSDDIEEAIRRWELAVDVTDADDPGLGMRQDGLARARQARAVASDLSAHRLLDFEVPGLDDDALDLWIRGSGFATRYAQGGSRADADRAADLLERSRTAARDDLSIANAETALGDLAVARLNRRGNAADFDEAIRHYSAAVDVIRGDTSGETFTTHLARLVNALTTRAMSTGERAHMEEALQVFGKYIADQRLTDSDRGHLLASTAAMSALRARMTRSRDDCEAAAVAARKAVEAADDPDAESQAFSQLTSSLGLVYELFGETTYLREAAEAADRAVELSAESDPARTLRLLNAAVSWLLFGEHESSIRSIDRALELLAGPADSPGEHQFTALFRTQACHHARYGITRERSDLDAAVAAGLAVWNFSLRHSADGYTWAFLLTEALTTRGSLTGALDDMDQAARIGEHVLNLLPEDSTNRSSVLFQLRAKPALYRFGLSGDQADLNTAIEVSESALRVAADDDDIALITVELGKMLRTRFEKAQNEEDLRSAARYYRELAEQIPLPSPAAWEALVGLARTHQRLFRAYGKAPDAREAADRAREIATRPDAEPAAACVAWMILCEVTTELATSSPGSARLSDAVRAGEAAMTSAAACNLLPEARQALALARYAHYLDQHDEALFTLAAGDFNAIADESVTGDDRAFAYAHLGRLHRERHTKRRSPEDLDRAIEFLGRAVDTVDRQSPQRLTYARELYELRARRSQAPSDSAQETSATRHAAKGETLLAQFTTHRDRATLMAAISEWFAAAAADPDQYGHGLITALTTASTAIPELRPLYGLYQQLATVPASADRPAQSVALVTLLHRHWRETLGPDAARALRDAITVLREADDTGPDFPLAAGEALHDLFTLTGDEPTLRAAIAALEDFIAISAADPRCDEVNKILTHARARIGDSLNKARSAADLANARWQLEPNTQRAEELLAATERAAATVSAGHPEWPSLLGNVANAALQVANSTREPAARRRAVTAARAAADAAEESPEPDGRLRDQAALLLASALQLNIWEHYDQDQADEAIRLATGLFEHPQLGVHARSVVSQALLLGQPDDPSQGDPAELHQAVRHAREAMELTPETDPNYREARRLLMKAVFQRFFALRDTADLIEALHHLSALPDGDEHWLARLLPGLTGDGTDGRPEPSEVLAGLGTETARLLAERAVELATVIREDHYAEWLVSLRAHLAAAEMRHGQQRFLVTMAWKVKGDRPALALRLLQRVVNELDVPQEEDSQRGAAEAWSLIGELTEAAEQWDDAFTAYERAMELYSLLGDSQREVERLRDMADVSSRRDSGDVAAAHFDRAIRRAQEASLAELEADILMLSLFTASPEVAVVRAEQARDRFMALGKRDKAVGTHGWLGSMAARRGDADEAIRQVEAAAGLAQSADAVRRTYMMVWQEMVGNGLGEQAHVLEEGLALRVLPTEPHKAADLFYHCAKLRHNAGDASGAMISFREARTQYLAHGDRDAVASVDMRIAGLLLEADDIDDAISTFRAAGAELAEIRSWEKASYSYLYAGASWRSRAETQDEGMPERLRGASDDLTTAAGYAARSGNRMALFTVRVEQGRLEAERRRPEEAASHLAEAERMVDGSPAMLAVLAEVRARIAQLSTDTTAERDALEEAMDYFQQAGLARAAGGIAGRLAVLLEEDGDLRRARSLIQYAIDNTKATEPEPELGQHVNPLIGFASYAPQALHARAAMLDVRLGRLGMAWDNLAQTGHLQNPDHGHVFSAALAMHQAEADNDLLTALEIGQHALDDTHDPRLRSALLLDLSTYARDLGELELARDYATQGVALAEAGGGNLSGHLQRLGSASRALGQVSEAISHLRRAADIAGRDGENQPGGLADALNSLAYALIDHGDWDEAERVLVRALESARAMGHRQSEASLLSTRAALSLKRDDLDAASAGYRAAIRIQEDLGDSRTLAGDYANLGLVYLKQGDRGQARALTERALDAERRGGRRTGVVLDLIALADLEEPDAAAVRLDEALAISREIGFSSGVAQALSALGRMSLLHGEPAAARDRITEAIEVFGQIGDIPGLAGTYYNRSSALDLLDDLPAALRDAEEADRLWRLLGSGQESPPTGSRLASDHLIMLCTKAGRAADTWRYVERDKAQGLLARLNAGEWPAPASAPGELIDRESSLLHELRALQADAVGAREPARREAATRSLAPVQAELEEIWDELAISVPEYAALRRATIPARNDLDRIVANGKTGLLGFHLGESQTTVLIYAGSPGQPVAGAVWRIPDDALEFLRQAKGGRAPILYRGPDGEEGPIDGRLLLAATLLRDGFDTLIGHMDLLYLLPHGRLNQLPLHTLPTRSGTLLDQVPVAYAPSAGVLSRLLARPRSVEQRPSRVLGYAPPEAEKARAIIEGTATDTAAALSSEPQCGADATRGLLTGSWHVLHLSCHGEFNEQDPFGSGVWLADGLLTAREIMGLRINADLVVLAACESGQSREHASVDMAGLGYALLHAGARCALLTLWPVKADVTRTLMASFYDRLVRGRVPGAALREALMELRQTPEYDNPAVWGAYVLVGDAGLFIPHPGIRSLPRKYCGD